MSSAAGIFSSSDDDSDNEDQPIVTKPVANPRNNKAIKTIGSDDESDDSDDDSDDDMAPKSRKRRRNEGGSTSNKKKPRKKTKKQGRNQFIDDGDSDMDSEGDMEGETEREDKETKRLRLAAEARIDRRRNEQQDVLQGDDALSAEQIAAKFAERNKLQRRRARYFRKR